MLPVPVPTYLFIFPQVLLYIMYHKQCEDATENETAREGWMSCN